MVGNIVLGVSDGITLRFAEGISVGHAVTGDFVGVSDGDSVLGFREGALLGAEGSTLLMTVGTSDGTELGTEVMDIVGSFDGLLVGAFTGAVDVGMPVGISVKVGWENEYAMNEKQDC